MGEEHCTPLPTPHKHRAVPILLATCAQSSDFGELEAPAAMAIPLLLLLLLAMFTGSDGAFCVCKPGQSSTAMQSAIDYACAKGADCTQIMQNGPCYNPNSVVTHCSYATNSYYQKNSPIGATCDFSGVATLTTTDPSAGTCKYPASASGVGTGTGIGTGTGTGTGVGTGTGTGTGTSTGTGAGTGTSTGAGTGTGTGITPPGSTTTGIPGSTLSPPFGSAYGPSANSMNPDLSEAATVGRHVAACLLAAAPFLFHLIW